MTDQEREFYMRRRQALIIELGALEELLGMERSIVPKRKRVVNLQEPIIRADRGYPAMPEVAGTCADCLRGDCEKARQGIEHT